MSFSVNFPLFSVVLSLMSSVICSVVPGKAARRLTIALTALVCVMNSCLLVYTCQIGQTVTYMMGHYPHPWGNELRFGIIEPLFTVAFSLVMFLCIVGGQKQLAKDLQPEKSSLYYVMLCLVQASLIVLAYTNDLFTSYVFIEICTLSACGLLMIRQIGRTTLASVRYMIFSLLGSGLFLFGAILLYNITGHLLMPNIYETVHELWETGKFNVSLTTSICLITVGLSVKSGLFPFHFWMPDTYGYSTPCSAGILSGLISKGYTFLLIKVIFQVIGTDVFYSCGVQNVLYVFGILGIIFGSVSAIKENDIFRMTAYSSAAQIGYLYMGLGISPTFGVGATLFHILTHAMTKPALFLAAAQLKEVAGGKTFRELQGTAHVNVIAGAAFSFGAFSMIGLPLTMGFISKYLFAMSAIQGHVKMVPTLIVLALSTILNTFYFARTVIRLYNKPNRDFPERVAVRDQKPYVFSAVMFLGVNITMGIFAQPFVSLIERGIELL